jgi:hypothetical protein
MEGARPRAPPLCGGGDVGGEDAAPPARYQYLPMKVFRIAQSPGPCTAANSNPAMKVK